MKTQNMDSNLDQDALPVSRDVGSSTKQNRGDVVSDPSNIEDNKETATAAIPPTSACKKKPHDATNFEELLNQLPIGKLYPELVQECLPILRNWEAHMPNFHSKMMKKTQSPMPRILKELNEAAPVIMKVRDFVEKANFPKDGDSSTSSAITTSSPDAATAAHEGACQDEQFTIVDLGCGLGILSMFLSELLPKTKIKECFLVDKMWPQAKIPRTNTDGMHMTKEHLEYWNNSAGNSTTPCKLNANPSSPDATVETRIPLKTLKLDIKKGRDLADLVHFIFENGSKETRGSGNRIGGTPATASATTSDSGGAVLVDPQGQPLQNQKKNRIILLGIHLCGSLSLRFVELINKNPDTVEFAALKPCCLPGKMHLHHEMLYRVGGHEFTAQEVYYPGVNRNQDEVEKLTCLEVQEVDEEEKKQRSKVTVDDAEDAVVDENSDTEGEEDDHENETYGMTNWDEEKPKPVSDQAAADDAADAAAQEPPPATANTESSSKKKTHSGRGKRRFRAWCSNVFQCLTIEEEKTTASIETHRVAPHYFQDQFLFVERERKTSDGQGDGNNGDKTKQNSTDTVTDSAFNRGLTYNEDDRAFRNQILIPRYQRKKEENARKKLENGTGGGEGGIKADVDATGGGGGKKRAVEKIPAKRKANALKTKEGNIAAEEKTNIAAPRVAIAIGGQ
ncbi:unnamed protein product [Amoebophrya sp. A120]|nr:unnamed protein product [Amoebophrya sp. A120]|eukprot:GSA120T00009586001.1